MKNYENRKIQIGDQAYRRREHRLENGMLEAVGVYMAVLKHLQ